MAFGKGRDNRVAFVEDSIQNVAHIVTQSIHLLEKEITIESEKIKKEAKQFGNGDKEIEIDIASYLYENNPISIWEEYISDLRGAHFCSIYNMFEKLLKFIRIEFDIIEGQKDKKKSYVYNEISYIKAYLAIESFDAELEGLIAKIETEYKNIRVNITHGETKKLGYLKEILKDEPSISVNKVTVIFHNNKYLNILISDIQKVIILIARLVEEKSKKQ
ncbi:hypothetical protein IR083_10680 [Dysgonomonas sp. GY75]|uniref:hypothetical protein n=1 Tax=Dysgonomonas sp. GY75 TaxID=2780419 RepID=UPI00188409EF|nr:hypothetical protein [Dysgonomonas sp. GY75]MBF0649286.1 hypothetical protein [Dysgonomonas sp. GY75]